jgi:hypothetical protein
VTVFNGYDLGSPRDCRKKRPVVLKSFRRTTGVFERSVYLEYLQEELSLPLCGFAQLLDHGYQERLRYIMLEKLGSSLQHVLDISPEKRFNEQMTLSLAIQSVGVKSTSFDAFCLLCLLSVHRSLNAGTEISIRMAYFTTGQNQPTFAYLPIPRVTRSRTKRFYI